MFDPITIGMLVILAVLVFFMFRNGRKRQREAAELQQKVQVGADVMTSFGLYGTVLDIDEDDNKVLLETSPGTVLTVHRQVVTRVIDDHDSTGEGAVEADSAVIVGEPAYGERIEEAPDAITADDTVTAESDRDPLTGSETVQGRGATTPKPGDKNDE